MNESTDDNDAGGHAVENRKRNRAIKHDNSGSSLTMYPPKRTIALNSLRSVEGDEKDTVEALYSLSQSCEAMPVTPTGPMHKVKKTSSDEELHASGLPDTSPERLAYLMDLNASGRISQSEKDELFNLLVKRASLPEPPPVPVLERKRTHSSDSIKLMAAPVGMPRSREGSLNGLACKSSSPSVSPFRAKNTYASYPTEEHGKRPSLRKYEKLQTIMSGVELEPVVRGGSLGPENMRASVDVNDALKGLSIANSNVHFHDGNSSGIQQGVSRESSGSSTNSSSRSSGSGRGRKPRTSKGKSTSTTNAAIPYEFGDSGLTGFSVMSIPSVKDDLTPAVSREGSAFSLLLNALEQTSNRSLPTQWSNNPVDNDRMIDSRDVSASGAGLTQSESFYPSQYATTGTTTANASTSVPQQAGASCVYGTLRTTSYPQAAAASSVAGGNGAGIPAYTTTYHPLPGYSAIPGAATAVTGTTTAAGTGYVPLNGMSLQQPVTYAPYYPASAGMMGIDTTLSASYSSTYPGVNYAIQPLDTPNSTASGVTNYAFMGSGSNTPSVSHHQPVGSSTSGQPYTYDAATGMQTQYAPQQHMNYNSYPNMSQDDDDKGKLDKEGRYVSRNNYRCGKCGKQKANHVCAYVDTALTSMAVQTVSPILDTYHMAIFAGDKILTAASKRKNIHDTFDYAGHHNKYNFNQYRPFNPATYVPHLTCSPLVPGTRPPQHNGTQLYSRLPFTYDMVLEQLRMVTQQQLQSTLQPLPVSFYGNSPSAPVMCQPAAGQQKYVNSLNAAPAPAVTTAATTATTTNIGGGGSGVNKSGVPQLIGSTRGSEMAVSTTSIDSELSLF